MLEPIITSFILILLQHLNTMIFGIYCIGHKQALFEPTVDYCCVTPTYFANGNLLHIPDNKYGDAFNGKFLSEYTQLLGLRDFLKEIGAPRSNYIYVFQYRKFISLKKPTSVPASNVCYTYPVLPFMAKSLFPDEHDLKSLFNKSILGPVVNVGSLAKNYSMHHCVEDFVSFALALRETIFNAKECDRFSKCELIIPAPSLGLIKIDAFLDVIDKLEVVWSYFYQNFYVERGGYQRRVGGFLLERLNSYLLLMMIENRIIDTPIHGYQITISDSDIVSVTI